MAIDESPRADLQARVEQMHGVSFERILGEIGYLRDPGDSVIAGGSLAYGLGNHLSDLDLVVGGPTTVDSTGVPLEHFIGSLRVDVWKLAQGLIEGTFERAEKALESQEPLLGFFGDVDHEDELKLMHRVVFGVVVDGGGFELTSGRDHRAIATDLVVREYAERMRTSALLAQLALRAGRAVAAVVNARLAVEEALNAVIVQRGLPFTGDKWLQERLVGQAADLAPAYEPFRQLPEDPSQGVSSFVHAALAACVGLWGIDLEVDALASTASWGNTDLQLFEVGTERFLVSAGAGAVWALDEAAAKALHPLVSVDGAGSGTTWAMDNCDAEELSMCLRLHESGLLSLKWTGGVASGDLQATRSVEA
ncbi:MAG: hypothetical protein ACTHO8_14140 [Solirubrobacterales bacterium]